ncbi:MAG TPA: 23S rRNA (adenine(2503)-C(2))-methyltransferase RlmN [Syntrophomonas sp.]|jgi:23S rRNA (adenine2503-C2)-methyltransferase|nr:23S rRNA (adenine(2503)-C(2))-methyltransferase RlmN [Syntrophomonas sp.]HCF71681.1 23S rRNA (adenine(2503)-C(2))-methyltransferase RlmN [Syntrophomonas sp.]
MAERNKIELLGMNEPELEKFAVSIGEKPFRGRQIHQWIYQKEVSSFYEMNDLSKSLRQKLDDMAQISILRVLKQKVSDDGTRKFLMELNDKKKIETVVIPQSYDKNTRFTLCLSSQVGCPVGCSFCATGRSGFQRNLLASEMVGQVLGSNRELSRRLKVNGERPISSIVYMGMGEPMFNYDEVIKSIHILNDSSGMNIGQRHITISTSGEVQGIARLAHEELQVTLAVSLHACNNQLRDRLIPMNKKYPLEVLLPALRAYIDKTRRRITFEYIMLDNVNISHKDAQDMIKMLKPFLANVNLIPYNEVKDAEYSRPSSHKIKAFYNWLVEGGLTVTMREERGADIDAACGQLAARKER